MAPKMIRYRFRIEPFTPETLPLARLAEYCAELAVLLGNKENVHLLGIEKSSTIPVVGIDWVAVPKVEQRLKDVRAGFGPEDAHRAFKNINQKLATDNASGQLFQDIKRGAILVFPGHASQVLGPFYQPGTVDGELIKLGGEGKVVPIHLLSEGKPVICHASREIAKRMAPYIFEASLRVYGTGRWERDVDGNWQMSKFKIEKFVRLEEISLVDTVEKLKGIKSGLQDIEDPLSVLDSLRRGGDDKVN
jgi:hypothetical protein